MPTAMKRPEWLSNAQTIWAEDDALPPDRETLDAAWLRIFGHARGAQQVIDRWDAGDAEYIWYAPNRIAVVSFPGASEIRVRD